MPRYVQAAALPTLPVWWRGEKLDLLYVGYGIAVVGLVFASYFVGALGWLPTTPRR